MLAAESGVNMDIPSTRPFFSEIDIQTISGEISSILRSGQFILGPYTKKFEELFQAYCGVKHAIAVSSCTAALEISLRRFDVVGKEVIVPTNTFVSTGNAVIDSGGILTLADIRAETLCLDPSDLLRRITSKTRGVIVVHIAGLPCPDMEVIKKICQERNLFLIEDAAHAHGAIINGHKAGGLGDVGCFSFYPTKVMTTGTGGMITTNDDKLAEYAISLRNYGVGQGLENIVNFGNDWFMNEISALLGIYQLRTLEVNVTRRNEIARKYADFLVNIKGVGLFKVPGNIRHSYYKYPIFLPKSINKRQIIDKMKNTFGVAMGTIYDPPCHLQPVYQRHFGFGRGMFPIAEEILGRTCCLPMYQQMNDEEVNYVLQSLKATLSEY